MWSEGGRGTGGMALTCCVTWARYVHGLGETLSYGDVVPFGSNILRFCDSEALILLLPELVRLSFQSCSALAPLNTFVCLQRVVSVR